MLQHATTSDAGVSLLEVLVVLILIAAAVGLIAPNGTGPVRGIELETTADDLAARLREARSRAIAKAAAVHVDFAPSSKRYAVSGDPRAVQLPSDIALTLVMARSGLTEGGGARLTFFADGSTTGGDIRLTRLGRTIDVTVLWLTGAVTVRSATAARAP
jgi:general secretion pathway protein H